MAHSTHSGLSECDVNIHMHCLSLLASGIVNNTHQDLVASVFCYQDMHYKILIWLVSS